jgi:reactive intermediate/imine deaminase
MPHPVFVSATSAPDAGPDVARQTTMTLARLDERLRAERSSLADTVAITVYLRTAADFAAMNDAYRQAWKAMPPTRTTVVTEIATKDALVEMTAVAVAAAGERRLVHPASWAVSPNPYSYGVRTGERLFLSGLIPRNGRDNAVVTGDIGVQTHAVLDNARELLDAAGLSLAHVVSARVFLPDLGEFEGMNRVYREYFPEAPPARATVGAALTAPAYKVEMTFVASAGPRRVVQGEGALNPNLSAAIVAGDTAYLSGLLADASIVNGGGDAEAQTRDVIRKIDALLGKAGMSRADVLDLLAYVTDEASGRVAAAACRTAFGAKAAVTPVRVALAMAGARVEIMTTAAKA